LTFHRFCIVICPVCGDLRVQNRIDETSEAATMLRTVTDKVSPDLGKLAWVVTNAELSRGGFSRARINSLLRVGELVSLEHGVYMAADTAAQLRQLAGGDLLMRAAAALATCRAGAVISHHTAAELHGLDLLSTSPGVAITRPPGHGSRSGKTGVQVHAAMLPAGHVGSRVAIPLTTVARTVIDLARQDFTSGVVVADSALRKRLTSKHELQRVLAELRRSRGALQAAAVVEFADCRSESVLESIARVTFRESGLPPPELQVELGGDEFAARVDFYWREFRTVVEVDGAMKYDDRYAAMRQLQRDARLRRAGFEVEHFGWREITETPDQVAATIRIAFRRGLERAETERPAS
jgi:predicted transcriptional regulator of viral defense system